MRRKVVEDVPGLDRIEDAAHHLAGEIGSILPLLPARPELQRRTDRGITRLVRVRGQDQLDRKEEVGAAHIGLLIAYCLRDALLGLLA